MPHPRARFLLPLLEKRLKLFPVVGILGARQTGKSTLLRDLLPTLRKTSYVTLDREETRGLALRQPTLFIQNLESPDVKTACIDEVQKAPALFDTIKAEVDERKRPGRFALSGSTEFSKKTGVQESLTGRIALLRMFPLNLAEIAGLPPAYALTKLPRLPKASAKSGATLKDVQLWLNRGGLPGIFSVREESNREALLESWVETTCTRDLAQFGIARFNPELARRILTAVARVETPNRTEIARTVGKTPRQIENYLQALKSLFVLYEVDPSVTSSGKSFFHLFDSGIAEALGANTHRRLQTWFLNECGSQFSCAGLARPDIFHYETARGSRIDFIVETKSTRYAVKLSHEETPSTYTLRAAEAFRAKHSNFPVYLLAPCLSVHKVEPGLTILPWTAISL